MKLLKFKLFVFLLIVLVVQFSVSSQELKKRMTVLEDSIFKYYRTDSLKTVQFIKSFINTSKLKNNPEAVYRGYHVFVCFYFEIHRDQQLQNIYTDSLVALAKDKDLKIQLLKGYHLQNDNLRTEFGYADERIFNNIFEARIIAKEIKNRIWECKFNQELAQFYMFSRQWDKSLLYLRSNLLELKKSQKSEEYENLKIWGLSLESTYISMSELFLKMKKNDSAKFYNSKAKIILDTLDTGLHQHYKFLHKKNTIEIHLLDQNTRKAEQSLNDALLSTSNYESESDVDFYKNYYSGIISFKKGNYKKATQYLEAIDTVRINHNERIGVFQNNLYKTLYKSFLQIENIKKADYYFEKHLMSMKSQMESNSNGILNLKKNEIAQYNNEVNSLKEQKSNQRIFIIAGLFFFITVIAVLSSVYLKRQKADSIKLGALLEELSKKQEKTEKPKKANLNIKNKEVARILEKLEAEEEAGYYLRTDCTVTNLSKKINTNTTYLSKIINSYYQKNFTTYINDLRMDHVLDRLHNDTIFRRYTIQSIANEVGFKSKESFNAVFKKRTGVLPSELLRALEAKNSTSDTETVTRNI